MKPRFEPDSDSGSSLQSSRLIDPEAYDASEQEFAASLERKPAPRFVVEPPESIGHSSDEPDAADSPVKNAVGSSGAASPVPEIDAGAPVSAQPDHLKEPKSDSWRQEVAARVNNYRARRCPRAPRYPSLLLKFDFPESVEENAERSPTPLSANCGSALGTNPIAKDRISAIPADRGSHARTLALDVRGPETDEILCDHAMAEAHERPSSTLEFGSSAPSVALPTSGSSTHVESSSRILEFPRSAMAPPLVLDELAEPIFDRPRILDVPEPLLPPPALGGISIEPGEQPETAKRRGFELPLQPAPRQLRLLAAFIDVMLVLAAFSVFAAIFFKITSIVPPLRLTLEFSIIFVGVLWAAYQYGLLVYSGTTPGLKAAKLRLSEFDGSPVPRKLRRWRVIASILSGASLALGYAWYFLDEDHLCWHDRITHTYLAPRNRETSTIQLQPANS